MSTTKMRFVSFEKSQHKHYLSEVYTFTEVCSAVERESESHKQKCNLCVVCTMYILSKANPHPSFPSGFFV